MNGGHPSPSKGDLCLWGSCEPRFAAVREAFETNLAVGDDLGATVAVFQHGRQVVDIGGGFTVDGTPYAPSTLQLLYSVTKAVTTVCLMDLVQNGQVRLDDAVTDYWPEFGQAGKKSLTVRDILGHKAGLVGFDVPVDLDWFGDWDRVVAQLAAQAPCWPLGSGHGYHALTYGFLVGEIIRRTAGKTVGSLLQERFCQPLSIELFIGLPRTCEPRVTPHFDAPGGYGTGKVLMDALDMPDSPTRRAFSNPSIDTATFNDPRSWRMEMPAVNGIGNARALAALFSTMTEGQTSRFSRKTVDDFRAEVSFGPDLVLVEQPTRFGAGFMLACPREPMLGQGSFGHNGRGGALVFAHPETGIAFAYVGNRLVHDPTPHGRLWRLLSALRDSL